MIATSIGEKTGNPAGAGWRAESFLKRMVSLVSVRRRERRLRLCEMLSLGEKRFVAVVEYGPEKFLLAGTAQNISLLKKFGSQGEAARGARTSAE